jgi:hypothetical protein
MSGEKAPGPDSFIMAFFQDCWWMVLGALVCGRWCILASCGVFGGKVMIEVLRTMRGRQRSLSLSLFFFLIFGQLCLFILWYFVMMIFSF